MATLLDGSENAAPMPLRVTRDGLTAGVRGGLTPSPNGHPVEIEPSGGSLTHPVLSGILAHRESRLTFGRYWGLIERSTMQDPSRLLRGYPTPWRGPIP